MVWTCTKETRQWLDKEVYGSDILITKTETKTRMIAFSFTETEINTEKILKTKTI